MACMNEGSPDISVIIPCYNEQDRIAGLLSSLLKEPVGDSAEIIVVDDGSQDDSIAKIRPLLGQGVIQLSRNRRNLGKGFALRRGLRIARGRWVVVLDADGEYDPCDLETVLEPLRTGQADVVLSYRHTRRGQSRAHDVFNWGLSRAVSIYAGTRIADVCSGYKAFSRPLLSPRMLKTAGFGFDLVFVLTVCCARGLSVAQVPVDYRARSYAEGKKIGFRDAVEIMALFTSHVWRWVCRGWSEKQGRRGKALRRPLADSRNG